MSIGPRRLLRLAHDIRTQLRYLKSVRHREVQRDVGLLLGRLEPLQQASRALTRCNARGWDAAAEHILAQVDRLVCEIPQVTDMVRRTAQSCHSPVPSLREVHQQLHQLADEFGNVEYDPEEDVLAVVTDPIELEKVSLGPFEIRLRIGSLAELDNNTPYDIVALGPHPARANPSVTHPSVCHEHLSAGHAAAPIRAALAAGRICHFFVLVRSVLTRYDPDSPYVRLDEWDGAASDGRG